MEAMQQKKSEVFIRSDGWVFTQEGMDKLVAGGHKGFNRFKENTEAKIGKWHRVSKPLDADAAKAVMGVKGMVARAMFVSAAILDEAARQAWSAPAQTENAPQNKGSGKFMRLTLTEDAYKIVRRMSNPDFRQMASAAILRKAQAN